MYICAYENNHTYYREHHSAGWENVEVGLTTRPQTQPTDGADATAGTALTLGPC